jgi:histidinol-phosphate phosphatase family protein
MIDKIRANQAVILCGGLGTRLRPFTNNLPKPMVTVNGKPFLFYLLEQLSGQGISKFLLLTGYLGEKIYEYFGDGSKYGWEIAYSAGPLDWDTGRRIWEARSLMDEKFLLLYSDNFAQFNYSKLLNLNNKSGTPISLLLAPKLKGNIKISKEGHIESYDNSRNGEGFDFVEIGYMLISRDEVLNEFPGCENFPNFSFSKVLQKLSLQKKLSGLVVHDHYHSISDPDRLLLMNHYLQAKKIILIDRDGTINIKAPKGEYITKWSDFKWIPETIEAMQTLAMLGFKFIVITNQAGIARNIIQPKVLEEIHSKMVDHLMKLGVEVLRIYVCPDHWNDNSFMRKPEPGMFFQAAKDFNLRLDHCLYVGDDERDCIAAANAGCGMVYLSEECGAPYLNEKPKPFLIAKNLQDLVQVIGNIYHDGFKAYV